MIKIAVYILLFVKLELQGQGSRRSVPSWELILVHKGMLTFLTEQKAGELSGLTSFLVASPLPTLPTCPSSLNSSSPLPSFHLPSHFPLSHITSSFSPPFFAPSLHLSPSDTTSSLPSFPSSLTLFYNARSAQRFDCSAPSLMYVCMYAYAYMYIYIYLILRF